MILVSNYIHYLKFRIKLIHWHIVHGRKLIYLGTGGLTGWITSFGVRDIQRTHYGCICPNDMFKGINVGLIGSLGIHARIGYWGSLVIKSVNKVVFLSQLVQSSSNYWSKFSIWLLDFTLKIIFNKKNQGCLYTLVGFGCSFVSYMFSFMLLNMLNNNLKA